MGQIMAKVHCIKNAMHFGSIYLLRKFDMTFDTNVTIYQLRWFDMIEIPLALQRISRAMHISTAKADIENPEGIYIEGAMPPMWQP